MQCIQYRLILIRLNTEALQSQAVPETINYTKNENNSNFKVTLIDKIDVLLNVKSSSIVIQFAILRLFCSLYEGSVCSIIFTFRYSLCT